MSALPSTRVPWTLTILVTCVFALASLGVVMLYSCTAGIGYEECFRRHLIWLGIGVPLGIAAACFDYRWFCRYRMTWVLLGLTVVLLVLTLIPGVGSKVNGARRWLFGFQPSEFAKVALIVAVAYYCSGRLGEIGLSFKQFAKPMLLILGVSALVFLEPDWGTATLLVAVGMVLLVVAGGGWMRALAVGIILFELAVIAICSDELRLIRVTSFTELEKYKDTICWQPWNAVMALGCGGWTGVGLGEGRLKLGFIPEQHTDFILAVIGEELGFVGAGAVLAAYVTIFLCGLRIAWLAPDALGQLTATGLVFLIGLQAFINIGVVTSSLPNKGIPLPLVSYGGSSLLATLVCIGLLVNIALRIKPRQSQQPATA